MVPINCRREGRRFMKPQDFLGDPGRFMVMTDFDGKVRIIFEYRISKIEYRISNIEYPPTVFPSYRLPV
jgi:hypothetical protein